MQDRSALPLSLFEFVRPSVPPSIRLSVSAFEFVRSPVRSSVHPSARPSVRPSARPSMRPSVHPSVWHYLLRDAQQTLLRHCFVDKSYD